MTAKKKPHYALRQVRQHLLSGKYRVTGNARETAKNDFGWDHEVIKKALLALSQKDFHKSTVNWDDPSISVDYYKARGLLGENVYTHFHIEDDFLIISSFKEI